MNYILPFVKPLQRSDPNHNLQYLVLYPLFLIILFILTHIVKTCEYLNISCPLYFYFLFFFIQPFYLNKILSFNYYFTKRHDVMIINFLTIHSIIINSIMMTIILYLVLMSVSIG